MAPKRKGGGKAAAGKQQRQQSLSEHDHFPLISKPATTIGKQIKVPGSHWEGRLAEDEENTMYLCTIVDFIALHTFPHLWSSFKTLGVGKGYSCSKALAPRVLKLDHKL